MGFLKTSNRINVLLRCIKLSPVLIVSRAQHGMYIIGDATCAATVNMWKDVVDILRNRKQIGRTLQLQCPRHQDAELLVYKPGDFEVVAPEGGCSQICRQRLECGHACEFMCHGEAWHRVVGCRKPCEKGRIQCGHNCPKRCSDPCGDCTVPVRDVALPCGHSHPELECWLTFNLTNPKAKCRTSVIRVVPGCGYEVEMECWESLEDFKCTKLCEGLLECRHQKCRHPCHSCVTTNNGHDITRRHAPCEQICGKDFTTCSHRCRRPCHSPEIDCGPCEQRCEFQCIHSRCTGKCGEFCVPCAEPQCTWSCEHLGRCNMPCGVPCDRLPCNHRCAQLLDCGHRCPSVCGEVCPSSEFCQECCSAERGEKLVDYVDEYAKIDLDEDPIIVLHCRHFFVRSFLDGVLEIHKGYERDSEGHFVGVIPNSTMSFQQAKCPECRRPISQIQRYNRVIKRAALDMLLKNIISKSQKRYIQVSEDFDEFEREFERSREESLGKLRKIRHAMQKNPVRSQNGAVITKRLAEFDKPRHLIRQFLRDVDEKKQPHMKVYQMSIAALSRAESNRVGSMVSSWPLDVPSPIIKFRLLGNILQLRLEMCWNSEAIRFVNRLASLEGCSNDAKPLYQDIIERCNSLCATAAEHKAECDTHQYPNRSVEVLLLHTELVAHLVQASNIVNPSNIQTLRESGLRILSECDAYFITYSSCRIYETAASRVRRMLELAVPFYQTVSMEERKAIYLAMQTEFRGNGHWYYCRNGHPFSIGNCGMPMEESRCPECGESVGGTNHIPVQGVVHAADFERLGM